MSFGFSPSDIVTLFQLVTNTYDGWKNACGRCDGITSDLAELQLLLARMKKEVETPNSPLLRDTDDMRGWETIYENCKSVVGDLQKIISKYKSLGENQQSNWERMKFGNKNLASLGVKLSKRIRSLSGFATMLGMSSQGRVENDVFDLKRKVDDIAAKMRRGDASVSTALTTSTTDDRAIWREFRKNLRGMKVANNDLHTYSSALQTYIARLQRRGLLDEPEPSERSFDSASTLTSHTESSYPGDDVQFPTGISKQTDGSIDREARLSGIQAQKPKNPSSIGPVNESKTLQDQVSNQQIQQQRIDQVTHSPLIASPLTPAEQKLFEGFEIHAARCTACHDPLSKQFSHSVNAQMCEEGSRYANMLAGRVFEHDGTFYRKPRPGFIGVEISILVHFRQTIALITALIQDRIVLRESTCDNCYGALSISRGSVFVKALSTLLCEDCFFTVSEGGLNFEVEGAPNEESVRV